MHGVHEAVLFFAYTVLYHRFPKKYRGAGGIHQIFSFGSTAACRDLQRIVHRNRKVIKIIR